MTNMQRLEWNASVDRTRLVVPLALVIVSLRLVRKEKKYCHSIDFCFHYVILQVLNPFCLFNTVQGNGYHEVEHILGAQQLHTYTSYQIMACLAKDVIVYRITDGFSKWHHAGKNDLGYMSHPLYALLWSTWWHALLHSAHTNMWGVVWGAGPIKFERWCSSRVRGHIGLIENEALIAIIE